MVQDASDEGRKGAVRATPGHRCRGAFTRWPPALLPALLLATGPAWAVEGLWPPDEFPARLKEALGEMADAVLPVEGEVRRRLERASLRLSNGCSAVQVSASGLLLTTQACVQSCAERLSASGRDLVVGGFLAHAAPQELVCGELTADRLTAISDVTEEVRRGQERISADTGALSTPRAFEHLKAGLEAACAGGDAALRCTLVPQYEDSRYKLYRYRRYPELRLVFLPEAAALPAMGLPAGVRGLDVAVLRLAVEAAQPDESFLRLAATGARADQNVLVAQHPGAGLRLLSLVQFRQLRAERLGALLDASERRGLLLSYADRGPEAARAAQAELSSVEAELQTVRAELDYLMSDAALERKQAQEQQLRARAEPAQRQSWEEFQAAAALRRRIGPAYRYLEREAGLRASGFHEARLLVRAAEEVALPDDLRLPEFREAALPVTREALLTDRALPPELERLQLAWSLMRLRAVLGPEDPVVRLVLGREAPRLLAARLIEASRLQDPALRAALWDGGAAALANADDAFLRLASALDPAARALRRQYENEVLAAERRAAARLGPLLAAAPGAYPEPDGSLRLSWGSLRAEAERGAPFIGLPRLAVPSDPGPWTRRRGQLDPQAPLAFVADADVGAGPGTQGGAVVDVEGALLGLAIGVSPSGRAAALGYEPASTRLYALDVRTLTRVLARVYEARALLAELGVSADQGAAPAPDRRAP